MWYYYTAQLAAPDKPQDDPLSSTTTSRKAQSPLRSVLINLGAGHSTKRRRSASGGSWSFYVCSSCEARSALAAAEHSLHAKTRKRRGQSHVLRRTCEYRLCRASRLRARSGLRTGIASSPSVTNKAHRRRPYRFQKRRLMVLFHLPEVLPKGQKVVARQRRATLPELLPVLRRALSLGLRLRPNRAPVRARSPHRQTAGHARRRPCDSSLRRQTGATADSID